GPTLRLELPIFNHGQGRIARLQAQLRQTERRLESQAIEIRSEVREARDRLTAKRDLATYYHDELLPERKRVLDLTLTHYNAMLNAHREDYIDETLLFLTLERGKSEPEYWFDIGRDDSQRFMRHHLALEYGITDHWMIDGRVTGFHGEEHSGLDFNSARFETR